MPDMLEEKDWVIVLQRIKDGNCASSIGSEACSQKSHTCSQCANQWEKKFDYFMEDHFNELHIKVYCQGSSEFSIDWKTRWEAYNRGI